MDDSFNPYAEWFGLASRSGRPNYYALLGVAPFESDPSIIAAAAERRMTQLASAEASDREPLRQKLTAEVARARQTLTDAALKKQYDELLRQKATPRNTAANRAASQAGSDRRAVNENGNRLTSDELLPPRATPAGPTSPAMPAAGDPMAPVMTSAPDESAAAVTSKSVPQASDAGRHVDQISDQLASARLAARRLAVRRQKSPYWAIASMLLLVVVVGVALAVAYVNGLIQIGPLPQVAKRDAGEADQPIVPTLDPGPDDSTFEPIKSVVQPPATKVEVEPASRANSSKPEASNDNAAPKPKDPPVDPAQHERFIAELSAARKALGERNHSQAKVHIAAAEKLAASAEQKRLVEGMQRLPKHVDGFWEAVREGLKGIEAAGELQVGNTLVSIVEVGAGRLIIRANGQNRRYSLDELPAGIAVAIAKRWFDERPVNKVYLGAFFFVDPRMDVAEAKRLWEEAAGAGIDVQGLLALLPIAAR